VLKIALFLVTPKKQINLLRLEKGKREKGKGKRGKT
jgi:hypothetical protein